MLLILRLLNIFLFVNSERKLFFSRTQRKCQRFEGQKIFFTQICMFCLNIVFFLSNIYVISWLIESGGHGTVTITGRMSHIAWQLSTIIVSLNVFFIELKAKSIEISMWANKRLLIKEISKETLLHLLTKIF